MENVLIKSTSESKLGEVASTLDDINKAQSNLEKKSGNILEKKRPSFIRHKCNVLHRERINQ